MRTKLLDADPEQHKVDQRDLELIRQDSIARAAALLRAGELVAFPTDTVYGLGAIASLPNAVARLYVAKGRPPEKAIPILIADVRDLDAVVRETSDLVLRIAARFWPGGLTLILPKSNAVSAEISTTPNVAVRLPDFSLTTKIIASVGAPLAVTSANLSGRPSSRTAADVLAQLAGRIAAVVDGGTCPGGLPSTILDCTTDPPKILRVGAVPAEALREVTPVA